MSQAMTYHNQCGGVLARKTLRINVARSRYINPFELSRAQFVVEESLEFKPQSLWVREEYRRIEKNQSTRISLDMAVCQWTHHSNQSIQDRRKGDKSQFVRRQAGEIKGTEDEHMCPKKAGFCRSQSSLGRAASPWTDG